MKGILLKRKNSWFVEYTTKLGAPNLIEMHPEYVKYYFLDDDAIDGEVYFETECYNGREYAKLIRPHTQTPMLDRLRKHLTSITPEQFEQEIDEIRKGLDLDELETNLDKALAKETTESLTEWMSSKREKELDELAKEDAKEIYGNDFSLASLSYQSTFKRGYNKAKETLYTEEDLRDCWNTAFLEGGSIDDTINDTVTFQQFLKSLKHK